MIYATDHFYVRFHQAIQAALVCDGAVIDVGTDANFRKYLSPFRDRLGPNARYVSMGYARDPNARAGAVDLLGDAHDLPLCGGRVAAVVCLDVLEHVTSPQQVVSEIWRVLAPGGLVVATLPFFHPFHGGAYPDFWRFTRQGVQQLFRQFEIVEISKLGNALSVARSYLGMRFHRWTSRPPVSLLFNTLDRLITTRSLTPLWLLTARKPHEAGPPHDAAA